MAWQHAQVLLVSVHQAFCQSLDEAVQGSTVGHAQYQVPAAEQCGNQAKAVTYVYLDVRGQNGSIHQSRNACCAAPRSSSDDRAAGKLDFTHRIILHTSAALQTRQMDRSCPRILTGQWRLYDSSARLGHCRHEIAL